MAVDRQRITRDAVLEGAHAILETGAYSDLTVDSLARSLRMSKSTLYKYFQSKEHLVEALVDQSCAATDSEIEQLAGREDLEAVIGVLGRHLQRLPRAVLIAPNALSRQSQLRLSAVQERLVASARAAARGPEFLPVALVAGANAAAVSVARGDIQGERAAVVSQFGRLMSAA